MSLETAIAHFRSEQQALFRSTADIKYRSGESFDPITGVITPTFVTRASDVPCLIRPDRAAEVQAGEEEVTLNRHEGKFPPDTELEVGDVVEITSSRHDARLVGKSFIVQAVPLDDWQIARRAVLEVNEG